jgi:hypothetical protein
VKLDKQAGAELCQAQFKLVKLKSLPSQLCFLLPSELCHPASYIALLAMGLHSLSDCKVCGAVHTGNTSNHVDIATIPAQGLVISLPYCYLNSEVQWVVISHYNRWQLIRTVGRGHSPSPSVTATMTYSSNNQVPSDRVMSSVLQCLFAYWSMVEGPTWGRSILTQ